MTRREIATHLTTEVLANRDRIIKKVGIIAKRMMKKEKRIHHYEQHIGSNTLLTIYIYGYDKKGVDYAIGSWYWSEKGLCWATVGVNDVVFYSAHFFKRYAERHLKRIMNARDAAVEFYKEFTVSIARQTEEIAKGIYRIQLPLYNGGLALGFIDRANNIVVYNTFVTKEQLGSEQINKIEEDKELNNELLNLDKSKYQLVYETLRMR